MNNEGPIVAAERDTLFAPLAAYDTLLLAVSGGPDSLALMHLVAAWARDRPAPRLLVLTVDHGLRAGSAAEASWAGEQADALGLKHEVLQWSAPNPATGIQEAARAARYELLSARARQEGSRCAIVTAHHSDDQAETFVMRLARGSGLDGLAAMVARSLAPGSGVVIERPLLTFPKTRLVATLRALGQTWIEDPSNRDSRFERARLRSKLGTLAAVGIGSREIARSAARLGRAKEALDWATEVLWERAVETFGGAYGCLDRRAFLDAPAALRVRLLARLFGAFGGESPPARLMEIEHLAERLASGAEPTATLGGCVIATREDKILVFREPGRKGLPKLLLQSKEPVLWDRRFVVASDGGKPVRVEALGRAAAEVRKRSGSALPYRALVALPSFWHGNQLLAVPFIDDFEANRHLRLTCTPAML